MKACHACGAVWEEKREPGTRETCLRCGADLHCCLNCRLYDPMRAHGCKSTTTDPPSDKESANSCEEFQMADRGGGAQSPEERRKALEEKWKSLFKD